MLQNQKPQPFLKWAGGKRSLLPEILPRLPGQFNTYFEPFLGGGAVFFALSEKIDQAILSDENLELILTYRVIQKEPEVLISKLRVHAEHHSKEYFYEVRKQELQDPIDIAARLIYLNKTCYNGLYRVNKSGSFNTPFGDYTNPNITQEENILACHIALQKTTILLSDFESIPRPQKGDLVYFDPPYHQLEETSFVDYTKNTFTERDQIRLRDFAIELTKKGVFVMLSNSRTNFIEEIYKEKYFTKHIVLAPRFINSDPKNREKVEEFLITNY